MRPSPSKTWVKLGEESKQLWLTTVPRDYDHNLSEIKPVGGFARLLSKRNGQGGLWGAHKTVPLHL